MPTITGSPLLVAAAADWEVSADVKLPRMTATSGPNRRGPAERSLVSTLCLPLAQSGRWPQRRAGRRRPGRIVAVSWRGLGSPAKQGGDAAGEGGALELLQRLGQRQRPVGMSLRGRPG